MYVLDEQANVTFFEVVPYAFNSLNSEAGTRRHSLDFISLLEQRKGLGVGGRFHGWRFRRDNSLLDSVPYNFAILHRNPPR